MIFLEENSKLEQFVSIAEFYLEFYLGIKQRDWELRADLKLIPMGSDHNEIKIKRRERKKTKYSCK